jgi:hypothetical protein
MLSQRWHLGGLITSPVGNSTRCLVCLGSAGAEPMEFPQNGGAISEILPKEDELSTRYYLLTFPVFEPEGSSSLIRHPITVQDLGPALSSSHSHNVLT